MIEIINLASSSKGNCYVVSNKETNILLECGISQNEILTKLKSLKKPLYEFDGCLITHKHPDHSKSINFVNQHLKIYANYETLNKYDLFDDNVLIVNNETFKIKSINVATYSINHGEAECNCFVLNDKDDTILFATDFMKIEQDLSVFKFNKIYIECNYNQDIINNLITKDKDKYKRQINTHCSLENLIIHLRKMDLSKCEEIVLIHCSQEVCNIKKCIKDIELEFGIPVYYAKREGGYGYE